MYLLYGNFLYPYLNTVEKGIRKRENEIEGGGKRRMRESERGGERDG